MRSALLFVLVAAAVLGAAGPGLAGEILPPHGWLTAEKFDAAVELAEKRNVGMAVVISSRSYDCPIICGNVKSLLYSQSLKDMLRVLLYNDETKSFSRRMQPLRLAGRPALPGLYLLDAHMRLLAYISSGRHERIPEMAAIAKSVVAWQGQAASKLQKAEKSAERGFYKRAMETVQSVADEDVKVTAKVLEAGESVDSVTIVEPKKPDSAPSETSEKKIEDAEKPAEGKFFPGCVETYRQKFEAMAREQLAVAEKCYQSKNYLRARELLAAMIRDGSDLEAVRDAKAMLEKVEAAQRQQVEQPAESPEDQTGDS